MGGVLCAWWCVVWRVHGCVFARHEQKFHEDQKAKKVLHDLSRSAKNPDVFSSRRHDMLSFPRNVHHYCDGMLFF